MAPTRHDKARLAGLRRVDLGGDPPLGKQLLQLLGPALGYAAGLAGLNGNDDGLLGSRPLGGGRGRGLWEGSRRVASIYL